MSERTKKFPWGYILIGLLLLLVGISFIAFSSADMLSILAIVIGIITAIFGIAYGALTLANHDRGVKFVFRIVISVACIIAGLVAIIVRNDAVSAIVNVVCILLLVDGSFKLQTAIISRRYRAAGWWIMLVLSITVIITAFLMTKYGLEDKSLTSILLGLIIIGDGVSNIVASFFSYANETRFFRELENAPKYKVVKVEDEGENAAAEKASEEGKADTKAPESDGKTEAKAEDTPKPKSEKKKPSAGENAQEAEAPKKNSTPEKKKNEGEKTKSK